MRRMLGKERRPLFVKLIRDKLDGRAGDTVRPANSRAGKLMGLYLKLHEEAGEIADSPGDPAEYADLLETLLETARENGVPWHEIERVFLLKHRERGGFRIGKVLAREM